jgi:N-acetylglutamate synthase-like GNAT family acetyltransferase
MRPARRSMPWSAPSVSLSRPTARRQPVTLSLIPAQPGDRSDLTAFLVRNDLTTAGVEDPALHIWLQLDADGRIEASTGFELVGTDALIRSVAVHASLRGTRLGTSLALFALARAADAGASRAWLFSRRSGAFWLRLGFEPADREELVAALAETHQVQAFSASGQLAREVAYSRRLP